MKKKILFVNRNFIFGGIEKSLFNIASVVKNEVDVDIKVLKSVGELKEDFERNFNATQIDKKTAKWGFYYKHKKGRPLYNAYYFFLRAFRKLITRSVHLLQKIVKKFPQSNGYDFAICYTQDPLCREYVLERTDAKKKIIFLHYDVSLVNSKELAIERLKQFDKVVCVSKSCAEKLVELSNGELKNVDFLYNFCPENKVSSEVFIKDDNFKLISASRLSKEKGLERFLQVLSQLKKDNFDFSYYIIGDGVCKKNLQKIIQKNNLQTNVKLLGYKTNPKDYIKDCNLFVLPSYEESFGMVLVEAMQVGTPCLTTETISARECLGDNGFVCENSFDGIYDALKNIYVNKNLLDEKRALLKNYRFNNDEIRVKFLEFINGGRDNEKQ